MSFFDVSVSKDLEIIQKQSKCNSKRVRKTSQQTESRSKRQFLKIYLIIYPRALFLVLGFYPYQILPGWLPSQPPALSLLSVLGFYPPQIPAGWLPSQTPPPRAFFAFGFWGFTRPKSPQVGCLPNPPRFLCFRFLGFYPPQIPPRLVAFPTPPPRFLCFRFLGFYPPQIPSGWLPSQPPALSLLSVFGVLPAPDPPRLVAFPTPRAFFAFGFWGFTRPKSPQVG